MTENVKRAVVGDRTIEYTDHQSEYFAAFTAFCQNRQYMLPSEAAEIIEHLKVMRAMSMVVFIPESKGH
jgi:intergrase/recombinase